MEVWYRIEALDSVYSTGEALERRRTDKAIRYSIIDTTGGATIEWLEYHLLEYSDTSLAHEPSEWVPMYRIVYRCDDDGTISSVVNYPEIKAQVDTLINTYISQMPGPDIELAHRIANGFMDSSWVMTSLLREAELIHRSFGLTFVGLDTLSTFSLQEYSERWLQPYFMIRTNDLICQDENISYRGWGDVGTMDLKSFLNQRLGQLERIDTMAIPQANGQELMIACFDTLRSLPTYLDVQRRFEMEEVELVQRVVIYEDQRLTQE